jgi:hypothetical protein
MGEIYQTRDPHLDHDVALKMLLAEFSAVADRLRRLHWKRATALNHPNIITIHSVEEANGTLPHDGALNGRRLSGIAVDVTRETTDSSAGAHRIGMTPEPSQVRLNERSELCG